MSYADDAKPWGKFDKAKEGVQRSEHIKSLPSKEKINNQLKLHYVDGMAIPNQFYLVLKAYASGYLVPAQGMSEEELLMILPPAGYSPAKVKYRDEIAKALSGKLKPKGLDEGKVKNIIANQPINVTSKSGKVFGITLGDQVPGESLTILSQALCASFKRGELTKGGIA